MRLILLFLILIWLATFHPQKQEHGLHKDDTFLQKRNDINRSKEHVIRVSAPYARLIG